MIKNILLTGATGFLGASILKRLLFDTKDHIYILIRAQDRKQINKKKDTLLKELFTANKKSLKGITNKIKCAYLNVFPYIIFFFTHNVWHGIKNLA